MYMVRPCGKCEHFRMKQYENSHTHKYWCAVYLDMDERTYCSKYKRKVNSNKRP